MLLKSVQQFLCVGVALLLLNGCVSTRNSLVDVRAVIDQSGSDKAYKAIVMTLLDKGFDVKMNDKDLRIVTTEYKKFYSVSGWPPFDFYLQVKGVVRDTPDGQYEIVLSSKVKEQNRLNPSAFTERPLIVYSPDDLARMTSGAQAMQEGQFLFLSIVQAVADSLGLPMGQFKQSLQQIEVFGM